MPFTDQLISLANVYRRADTSSAGLGPTTNTGPFSVLVASAVPCRVAQQSTRIKSSERTNDKDAVISLPTIFTDYRTDLAARQRFIILDGNGAEIPGQTYETLGCEDPGLMHHHLELPSKKVG